MNTELKKVVDRIKLAQKKMQKIVHEQEWMKEARKYAEKQGVEVKKLFSSDIEKVKAFMERERKELERFQKQIPGEVKKFGNLLNAQRAEFEKIMRNLKKTSASAAKKAGTKASKAKKTATSVKKKVSKKIST